MENISYELYESLTKRFKYMERDKILVVTALTAERLWKQNVEGIPKSEYSQEVLSELLQISEQWMQMIWERIINGYVHTNDRKGFKELYDRYQEIAYVEDSYGEELDMEDAYFVSFIWSKGVWSFFDKDESNKNGEECASTISQVLQIIVQEIGSILYYGIYEESGII